MHAVAAHQLHRASACFISSFLGLFFVLRSWFLFLVLHPSPSAYKFLYALFTGAA
jgi:hypothetical protein